MSIAPKNHWARLRKNSKGRPSRHPTPHAPDISIEKGTVGRETLNVILREMGSSLPPPRQPFVTIGYDDGLFGQPTHVVESPPPSFVDQSNTAPEVVISETRPGLETMAVIDEELLREARRMAEAQVSRHYEESEVLELMTFIILDWCLPFSATEQERREFVAKRLWHRLPPGGMETVRRIDIRPADESALMLRIWCAVPKVAR